MIFLVQFGINEDSYILQRLQNFTRTVDKTIFYNSEELSCQVKINDNNERRFGVVMTPFSSSKMKRIILSELFLTVYSFHF